jgi:hypothetical protein
MRNKQEIAFGELAKLGSSLHFVSLRMTGIYVFKEEVVGGCATNHLLLPLTPPK